MNVTEAIANYFTAQIGAQVTGKGQSGAAKLVIAEQRSLLSRKRVEYTAKFKVDDHDRVVRFFEMLKESGAGMSGDDASDFGGGWGVTKSAYRSGPAGREGTLEAQGALLGKKFGFTFDYVRIRDGVKAIAAQHDYRFEYQLTSKGL